MKMRSGFSLLYAIGVVVLVGGLLAFSLRLSSETVVLSLEDHANIQLRLYEKSVAEMAIFNLQRRTSASTINAIFTPGTAAAAMYGLIDGYTEEPIVLYPWRDNIPGNANVSTLSKVFHTFDGQYEFRVYLTNVDHYHGNPQRIYLMDIIGTTINPMPGTNRQLRIATRRIVKP